MKGHSMKVKRNCLNCGNTFEAEQREINRGYGKFCKRKCSATYNANKRSENISPNVICAYCKKYFYLNTSKQKNSKSGLFFCCRDHKDAAQRIGGIKEIMPPHYGETGGDYRTMVFKVAGKPKVCERCGFDKHEAAIIVHHKNKDRSDNTLDNLEVLCANCHAIEHWSKDGGAEGIRTLNLCDN